MQKLTLSDKVNNYGIGLYIQAIWLQNAGSKLLYPCWFWLLNASLPTDRKEGSLLAKENPKGEKTHFF